MSKLRELDERTTPDGLRVRLLWNPESDEVVLKLYDGPMTYEPVIVDHAKAREAFIHPFAFVADEIAETPDEGDPAKTT